MAPRKRSNLLALAALSLLIERTMHPYEMAVLMRQRGLASTVKLNLVPLCCCRNAVSARVDSTDGNSAARTF